VPKVLCETLNAYLDGFSHEEWQTLLDFLRRISHNAEVVRDASAVGKELPREPV
jgi:hypothetical protein